MTTRIFPAFLCLVLSIGRCFAQSVPAATQNAAYAELSGTVTDAQDKPLKDARVSLAAQKLTALTDAAGKYAFKFQPVSIPVPAAGGHRDAFASYSLSGRLLTDDAEPASPAFREPRTSSSTPCVTRMFPTKPARSPRRRKPPACSTCINPRRDRNGPWWCTCTEAAWWKATKPKAGPRITTTSPTSSWTREDDGDAELPSHQQGRDLARRGRL